MRIARLKTTDGARHAIWMDDAWAVVEDGFADPPIRTGVTVAADDADGPLQVRGVLRLPPRNGRAAPSL